MFIHALRRCASAANVHRIVVISTRTLPLRFPTSLLCAYLLAEPACYHNAREGFAIPWPHTRTHKLHTLKKLRRAVPIPLHQVRRTRLSAPGTHLNQAKRTKCKPCTNCKRTQLLDVGVLVEVLLAGRLTTVMRAQTEGLLPVCSCNLHWNGTEILQRVPRSSNGQLYIHISVAPIANANG